MTRLINIFMSTIFLSGVAFADLTGSLSRCNNEGQMVHVAGVTDNPCISCMCKRGIVRCDKQKCPLLEGCPVVTPAGKDRCCDVCKGCVHKGVLHASDTEWMDEDDNCNVLSCKAGVVTSSQMQCYTPCSMPIPPRKGECCPSCKVCKFNGHKYKEGQEATLSEDPCVRCLCKGGLLTCSKRACPVLTCPPSYTVHRKGACCPECNGSRSVMEPPGHCILGKRVLKAGVAEWVDNCTSCVCQQFQDQGPSTVSCLRHTCPVLDCLPEAHERDPLQQCCPRCRQQTQLLEPSQKRQHPPHCSYQGTVYEDGDTWRLDECRSCECRSGVVRCSMEACNPRRKCKPGFRPIKQNGDCCPKCVEDDAVCTVFGDPHYKTFDGRTFTFQGTCKYLLAADCKKRTFSVRVRNDARSSRFFSWTKAVTFKLYNIKVTLGQRMRVKVNNKRVQLPYKVGQHLSIVKDGYVVVIKSKIGVKLVWDGESFLEVSVPPKFKRRLCGLCGNYNSVGKDDFRTRRGKAVSNAASFGKAWRVGGRRACSRPEAALVSSVHRSACESRWEVRRHTGRKCEPIKGPAFQACHRKVNHVRFFKSCLLDMCECPPHRQCHCEAFMAYAHECQREGVHLEWRNATGCLGHPSRTPLS